MGEARRRQIATTPAARIAAVVVPPGWAEVPYCLDAQRAEISARNLHLPAQARERLADAWVRECRESRRFRKDDDGGIEVRITPPQFDDMHKDAIQMRVRRMDGREIERSWSWFYGLLTTFFGDAEAVEVYPPAARLMNIANDRHLWVLPTGKTYGVGL